MSLTEHRGWTGCDLDGTLALYENWKGIEHIGEPVPAMLNRVKAWLEQGREVRIFTARVWPLAEILPDSIFVPTPGLSDEILRAWRSVEFIRIWCEKHLGRRLTITCRKDFAMVECWDDRAVSVMVNRGVDRETVLSWHLLRVLEAAGIKVVTGVGFATAADEGAAKIKGIIQGFENAEADLDGALSTLGYVKGQHAEDDARNIRHAINSLTKALKTIRRER